MSAVSVALFLRPATPGQAKTRLIPVLGPLGAAELYRAFARDLLATLESMSKLSVELWTAGPVDHPDLDFAPPHLPRYPQPEENLGLRMLTALRSGLSRAPACVVLGSDVPSLPRSHLRRALAELSTADVVLGPAADGGYYLVAARRTAPRMFDHVRMSTAHACTDTLAACARGGLSTRLAPPWFDVDTKADLALLRAQLELAPHLAPHTARVLGIPEYVL